MTRLRIFWVLGLTLAAFAPGVAVALTPQEEAILQRDCSGDYMRFCAQFDPDSPQVEACFRQRLRDLSPACRTSIQAFQKRGGRR